MNRERAVSRVERHGAARLALAVERVCSLPAAPTQSWCSCAAKAALPLLTPSGREGEQPLCACVVTALLHNDAGALRVIQAGGAGSGGEAAARQLVAALTASAVDVRRLDAEGVVETTHSPLTGFPEEPSNPLFNGGPVERCLWRRCSAINDEGLFLLIELHAQSPGAAELRRSLAVTFDAFVSSLARRADAAFSHCWLSGSLTRREEEVLRLLSQGLTVKDIALQLKRSPHTVHDHVKSLHRKLGACNRAALVAKALGAPLR
ncbi:MAG: LuxR family transcriptional regulator [Planctomycetota bacterium]|nr:MAG: LuxR family transcriptional regulator [Planctomycetota bacterium]